MKKSTIQGKTIEAILFLIIVSAIWHLITDKPITLSFMRGYCIATAFWCYVASYFTKDKLGDLRYGIANLILASFFMAYPYVILGLKKFNLF